jgi:hypothetical protein
MIYDRMEDDGISWFIVKAHVDGIGLIGICILVGAVSACLSLHQHCVAFSFLCIRAAMGIDLHGWSGPYRW